MKTILSIVALVSAVLFMNCSRCGRDQERNCDEAICTQMLASITVEVVDAANQRVALDEVYTMRKSTGEVIHQEQFLNNGRYIVLDDSYQPRLANQTDEFRFVGIKDGQKVVDEPFIIGADCCHIRMESGRDQIQLGEQPTSQK